jgi:hypothetical protein
VRFHRETSIHFLKKYIIYTQTFHESTHVNSLYDYCLKTATVSAIWDYLKFECVNQIAAIAEGKFLTLKYLLCNATRFLSARKAGPYAEVG